MNEETVISNVKSSVLQVDEKAVIILFGSRARGDNRQDSDWDFLILTELPENKETKDLIRDNIFITELALEIPISTIIHNKETWSDYTVTPLYQLIQKEGKRV